MARNEELHHNENSPQETPEQQRFSDELKAIAENAEGKLSQKTVYEKFINEHQTRKVPEEQQQHWEQKADRSESTRFERGQIMKAYKIMRTEITEAERDGERAIGKRALLSELRDRAKVMYRQLDVLENQFEHNVTEIEVDTKYGKMTMPVTELDLKEKKEGEKDDRVPYVFWGGINSNVETNGCVLMALALAGERVIALPHFEQKQVKKEEGVTAAKIFKEQRGFSVHAEATIEVINALGLEKYNLMGYSTGGNIALETAIALSGDEKAKGKLRDVIAIEPVGLDQVGLEGLATGLGKNIITDMVTSEARLKVLQQAAETNNTEQKLPLEPQAVLTLGEKHFTPERISEIVCSGKFQIWGGTASGLEHMPLMEKFTRKTQWLMERKKSEASRPQLVEVVGGTHYTPITNAMGFVREITKKENEVIDKPKMLYKNDLANSAARQILQDIGNDKK